MTAFSDQKSTNKGFRREAPDGIFVQRFDIGGTGPTVAVKDVIDVSGLPTIAGSEALSTEKNANTNAHIISQLLDANCRLIGKTTMHELAYGVTGINDWAGTPVNTNYPDLIPGGSSSGSAVAVSANLCDFAIGTDTGGSVRVPAACCGIFGFKPTFGRLSRQGLAPADSSLDCVGPFARTAQRLETAMRCIDPKFGKLPDPSGLKLAWIDTEAEAHIDRIARAAAIKIGGPIGTIKLEALPDAHISGLAVIGAETYQAFGHLLASGKVGEDVAMRLSRAADITKEELAKAEQVRADFTKQVDAAFEYADILALPTLPDVPPTLEEAKNAVQMIGITSLCRPFNLSGHPAISIPVGEYKDSPIGLQLVAPKGEDETLIALAIAFENLTVK